MMASMNSTGQIASSGRCCQARISSATASVMFATVSWLIFVP
jgi:hypothetical protein